MALSNDDKIKEYSKKIAERKAKLGSKPRVSYITNALITIHSDTININTLSSIEDCVILGSRIIDKSTAWDVACNKLGVDHIPLKFGLYSSEEYIEDLKTRCSILLWQQENNKLKTMDGKLRSLLSESAKTEAAISDIINDLGVD